MAIVVITESVTRTRVTKLAVMLCKLCRINPASPLSREGYCVYCSGWEQHHG